MFITVILRPKSWVVIFTLYNCGSFRQFLQFSVWLGDIWVDIFCEHFKHLLKKGTALENYLLVSSVLRVRGRFLKSLKCLSQCLRDSVVEPYLPYHTIIHGKLIPMSTISQDRDATPGQRVGGVRSSTSIAAHEQRGADQLVALSGREKTGRWIRTEADWAGRLSG